MSDNPGYGFVPSPSSPKKEIVEPPTANPTVVNNYFITINPQAILFVALLVILVIGLTRLGPLTLRA
jgi:hypothetical protein